jgi:imidazolonepropionase-like amidohydrolase
MSLGCGRLGNSILGLAIALAVVSCDAGTSPDPSASDPDALTRDTVLLFSDVNVVPMDVDQVLAHRDVVIRDGSIQSIEQAGSHAPPADAVVIDGRGRYLMPGLIDMHVHVRGAQLQTYLANGVLNVRNMWGYAGLPRLMTEVNAGVRAGPGMTSASPGVDGTPPTWPETRILTVADSAALVVDAMAAGGWTWIKAYTRLSLPVFDALMQRANELKLPVVGHVPIDVDVNHALSLGMKSIEHFTGYDRAVSRTRNIGTAGWIDADPAKFRALVSATKRAGTWNCPTLAVYIALSTRLPAAQFNAMSENRRQFVKILSDSGARLLVGTDAGTELPIGANGSLAIVEPALIHDELDEFVLAGLSPYQALRGATVDAAEFLERSDLGVVRAGARADLLLLEANPLATVRNVRRLDGIVVHGAWWPARSLGP